MLSGAADTVGGQGLQERRRRKKAEKNIHSVQVEWTGWRVVGDEEGEGWGGGRKLQSTAVLLYSASGATR